MSIDDSTSCPIITPVAAVAFAWAISAKFSENESTKRHGESAGHEYDKLLKKIQETIEGKTSSYCEYYGELIASMNVAIKNLETCRSHRNDNFSQDEDLRKQQIEAIDKLKTFGLSFENAIPKIASSTAIGGISGLTLTNVLNELNLSVLWNDVILFSFLGIGYLITDFVVLPAVIWRKRKAMDKMNVIKREHYQLYSKRCERELCDLFKTLMMSYDKIDEEYNAKIKEQNWDVKQVIPENEEYLVKYSGHRDKENEKK